MIDQGIRNAKKRIKALGDQSVHGLPLEWPESKRAVRPPNRNRQISLATQNVHGLPTSWNELN
jgi:hypothetical protein